MSQEYTVTSVEEQGRWTSSYGKAMVTYTVGLEELERPAQTNRLDTSPAPAVGDRIYGHIEDQGEHPPKLVKDQNPNAPSGGGGGGNRGGGRAGGGYSPQDIAAMRRSGAQDRALKFMEVRGLVPFINAEGEAEIRTPENAVELEKVILWFESNVQEAVAQAGQS